MTDIDDRRRYDPFAPHSLVGAVAPPEQVEDEAGGDQHDEGADDLEEMTKADLVAIAEDRGVATYGSKADIVKRLRG